jgi:predicted 3-demethylubiquinone-9 3-methyltransferase (glyoxalase superfamily)
MATTQKIVINLWFDTEAEEAAKFYTSVFKNSRIDKITRFPNVGQEIHKKEAGSVMTVEFTLEGQKYIGLNGGPEFNFSEAISLVINCKDQKEVDYYWEKLSEGGDPRAQQCGWLKDKFGLSWQVVPEVLDELISQPDKEKAEHVFAAMLKMKKLNVAELEQAAMQSA